MTDSILGQASRSHLPCRGVDLRDLRNFFIRTRKEAVWVAGVITACRTRLC